MKNLCITIIMIMVFVLTGHSMNYYTRYDCVVYSVKDNIVTVEDNSGHLWGFIAKDNHNYKKFDKVDLKMYNNSTEDNIQDDKVIGVD